jgi:glycine dehydrogenase
MCFTRLINYQTVVSDLTGLDISNASLLDEGTSAAEAMHVAYGHLRGKRNKFFASSRCHPQTLGVLQTRAELSGIELVVGDTDDMGDPSEYFGVLVQYPDTDGNIHDWHDFAAEMKSHKCVVVAATDLLALTLLKPPGEWGADIAVGSAQRFGVPLFYGGPHAGFFACNDEFKRKMPGRLIGLSVDSHGNPGYRLAMQTREQHIRRDKATSNICTAQALLANTAASYAVYHGPDGLRDIATRVHRMALALRNGLSKVDGVTVGDGPIFDTVSIDCGSDDNAFAVLSRAESRGINLRAYGNGKLGVSLDETATGEDVSELLSIFSGDEWSSDMLSELTSDDDDEGVLYKQGFARESTYLDHPVFRNYQSETSMMRYLCALASKDVSLTTSMISLGSCTMKLNAASEMEPVSWPGFANMHPFQPPHQCEGYKEMIDTLDSALCEITRFAAVSTQPNSGAAGEYAGLVAITRYLESIGEGHRNICLIPVSAHGTNPASAVMCGMKVVTVQSDDNGNIDIDDLRAKAEKHSEQLAATMITYPSTYGVFEEGVKDIVDLVHSHGGQVYMDGANMNAQVGLCSPGHIGADVCHLNLHKTFCIPHGGGGPGVGSIGVAKHLAPFLPGHNVIPVSGEGDNTVTSEDFAVASAPFGSAGILPISWMYIHMLGSEGLKQATQHAILNANYMASRLDGHYDVLYRGKNGQNAHEFILDVRPLKEASGITEEDIAKRLVDVGGFHAPTMSWPVAGTLMIEPTESESKAEMDRFCDAMIQIRSEIQDVLDGKITADDSPLRHAPHTCEDVTSDDWDRAYSRKQAAFAVQQPPGSVKYWPTVGRIDNVFGDRNLVCSCPPLEDYEEA